MPKFGGALASQSTHALVYGLELRCSLAEPLMWSQLFFLYKQRSLVAKYCCVM